MSLFVAVAEDGVVLGTIATSVVDQEEGHLRGMAVLPDWQGRGVAQRLLEAALAELRARGCTRVTLDTTEPLRRAVRFYEANGFAPTGRVAEFFGMLLYEYVTTLG
jgi:GNAT superfamily N-acetyltransferase